MSKFAFIFLFSYVFLIILTISRGAEFAVYLYELVYFLNPDDRWWAREIPNFKYSFLVSLMVIFSYFLHKNKSRFNQLKEAQQFKWFILLLLTYSLISFVAINKEIHNQYLTDLAKLYLMMYFFYAILNSEEVIEKALYFYIIGGTYIGYEAFTRGRNEDARVEGIGTVDLPDSNGTAAMLAPLIPILTYLFMQKSMKIKVFVVIAGVFIVNGLVLINSRGAFLGAIAGFSYLVLYLIFSRYKLPKQRIMIILIILGAFAGGYRLMDAAFFERMLTLQEASVDNLETSGGRRINFWIATFHMLEDHPFGLGIYGFEMLSSLYIDRSIMGGEASVTGIRSVHSMWFQTLSEIGYVGFFFLIALLISVFRFSRKVKQKCINKGFIRQFYFLVTLEAALIGFMVSGSFINAARASVFYWLLIFCISACVVFSRVVEDR